MIPLWRAWAGALISCLGTAVLFELNGWLGALVAAVSITSGALIAWGLAQ